MTLLHDVHLASVWGRVKTARMLIEHGVGVMAQNEDGETPLLCYRKWDRWKSFTCLLGMAQNGWH